MSQPFEFKARPPLPRVRAHDLNEFKRMLRETPPRGAKEVGDVGDERMLRVVCETRVVWYPSTPSAVSELRFYGVTP